MKDMEKIFLKVLKKLPALTSILAPIPEKERLWSLEYPFQYSNCIMGLQYKLNIKPKKLALVVLVQAHKVLSLWEHAMPAQEKVLILLTEKMPMGNLCNLKEFVQTVMELVKLYKKVAVYVKESVFWTLWKQLSLLFLQNTRGNKLLWKMQASNKN